MDNPVIESATSPPISLVEAKRICNVAHANDDVLIEAFVATSLRYLEKSLGVVPFTAQSLPPDLKTAALLLVRDLYQISHEDARLRSDNTEGVGSQSFTDIASLSSSTHRLIDLLLLPYREYRL